MVMKYMSIIKNLFKNKNVKMKETLNGLFVDIFASKNNDVDNGADDFDFDGSKAKPFNDCFFMHNKEYDKQYDESLDLFIPSGDNK